ncbi:MAG TPA: serpin family protein [Phycisphaerae bacterium]|nr:serpin family protein [Phycisphaerae bacterium]
MKPIRSIFTALLALVLFGGVSRAADISANDIANANNAFAFDLYAKLSGQTGNLFFSPYSVETVLAMTYAGARGNTATQMAAVLHLPSGDVSAGFANLVGSIQSDGKASPGLQLNIANSLWAQKGLPFQNTFTNTVRNQFDAYINQVDFKTAAEAARQQINVWVAQQTINKITNLIPEGGISSDTRLVLANAVYFKAQWDQPFDKSATNQQLFHLGASQAELVPMMHEEHEFYYADTADLQMLELPYAGGKFSMIVLLPKKIDGLAGLEKSVNQTLLKQLMTQSVGSIATDVAVSLPKFTLTTATMDLTDQLQQLGMTDAFSPDAADFQGIAGPDEKLVISALFHKAYVSVDEEGTVAAAASATVMLGETAEEQPPPIEFTADHPFLFLIQDNDTGAILFLGRMEDPNE